MKKLFLLLAIPFFLLSCNDDEEINNAPDSLVGTKWGYVEWESRIYEDKAYFYLEFDEDYVYTKANRNEYWAFLNGFEGEPRTESCLSYVYKNNQITMWSSGGDTLSGLIGDNLFIFQDKGKNINPENSFIHFINTPLSLIEEEPKMSIYLP